MNNRLVCKNCNILFSPPRRDAVYCGKRCRNSAYGKRKRAKNPPFLRGGDLSGSRFGRLAVMERTSERRGGYVVYRCLCDCGTEKGIASNSLRNGHTRSCGCLEIENRKRINSEFGSRTTTHGMHKTAAYKSWVGMKSRCASKGEKHYHGKGVQVCKRWSESFEAFLSDMGTPKRGQSIDRIDNSGNYEPGNCRWTDSKTQCRNRSNNVFVENQGEVMTVAEYAERSGMSWSGANKKSKREGFYLGRGYLNELGVFVKEDANAQA